jgi:Na+-driven multidrug efflux pump
VALDAAHAASLVRYTEASFPAVPWISRVTSASRRDLTLMQMSAPLMVSFVMRAAFTFVDTAYAATIGDAAVAAIGLTVPFEFLMIAIWVGLSTGLTAALSLSMTSGEGQKIEQYLSAAWRMVWVISPLFFGFGLLIWFAAPQGSLNDEVFSGFRMYAAIMIGGSAFTSFWSVIPDSIVKAHQDTRATMWAGIFSNLINVALNTLFLFVFHWGLFGIAFSTVLGRIGGLVYAIIAARRHEVARLAEGEHNVPGLDPTPYRTQLGLAIPAGLTFMLSSVEMAIVNTMLSGLVNATAAIAAYSIYHRVTMFAMNPLIAMSVAMLPFAARLVGKKDWEGLRAGIRQALGIAVGYSIFLVAPLMVLVGPWLSGALAESAQTAGYTRFALYLVPIACLASIPFFLMRPVFEALGQGKPGLIMAAIRALVLTVPLTWAGKLLAESMGQPGLYGMMMGLLVVGLISSIAFVVWLRQTLDIVVSEDKAVHPSVPIEALKAELVPDSGLQPGPPE